MEYFLSRFAGCSVSEVAGGQPGVLSRLSETGERYDFGLRLHKMLRLKQIFGEAGCLVLS